MSRLSRQRERFAASQAQPPYPYRGVYRPVSLRRSRRSGFRRAAGQAKGLKVLPMKDFLRTMAVAAALLVPAGAAAGQKGKGTLQVGANERTYYHIYHALGFAPEHYLGVSIRVAKFSDAAVYRQLMAGKLSLGSVVYLPEDVGVKGFDKAFKKAPTAYAAGHVAVLVLVPKGRAISGLSLSQLRDVVSGKITTWDQLGAGKGKLRLAGELAAWQMAATLTRAKLAKRLQTGKYHVGADVYAVGTNARSREEALRACGGGFRTSPSTSLLSTSSRSPTGQALRRSSGQAGATGYETPGGLPDSLSPRWGSDH